MWTKYKKSGRTEFQFLVKKKKKKDVKEQLIIFII